MPDQEVPKRLVHSPDRHPVVLRSGRRVQFDPEAPVLELEHGDAHDLCAFGRCSPAESPADAAKRFGLETAEVTALAKGSGVTTAVHRATEGEGDKAKTVDHTVIVLDHATVSRLRQAVQEKAAEAAAAKDEAKKAEKKTKKKDQDEG